MMASERYDEVPLEHLRLDPENPRLPREQDWASKSEGELLREFVRRYNLVELARSIADKGFTPRHAEALLVVEDPPNSHRHVVVEGNRRLATLKLLLDEAHRREAGTSSEWEALAQQARAWDLDSVPVIVYPDRDALNDYVGFRHITGPQPWRPEAKARFIARLLESGSSIGEVARRIGSNHRAVRRFAEAHAIFAQAIDAGFRVDAVEAGFGVFYNALDQDGVRGFLGLGRQVDINSLQRSPVPEGRLDHLSELIGLLYGDDQAGLDAVIRESRELRKLGKVLANEGSRANLLRDRDLERAWRASGGGREDLLGVLADLYSRLAEVNGKAPEYDDDEQIRTEVRRVHAVVEDMGKRYRIDDI